MQRLEKILAQTAATKVPEWPSYGNFRKVTQNLHFQKKCKGEIKRSFFKNRPESSPRFNGPTALWRKCNFGKVTQNLHFQKKCKGETKRNFSKIAQKVALVGKAQKHSGAHNIILYLNCTYSAKTGEDLGANSVSESARMAKLLQFSQGLPKPAFSEKVQRGDQRKFFKNRPQSSVHFNGPPALWRKCQCHLNCIHL